LSPPKPTFFNLNASTVDFNPNAPKPEKWLKFLGEVLGDETAIVASQEWFGYSLAPDTTQEKIALCVGPKRSGKGTWARVLTGMLGKHSVAGPTMGSLSHQFGLEALINKPLAIISDARIGQRTDKSVIVERLLAISGEDTLTVDRKFKSAWSGRLPTRFAILTNELPSLTDGSGALVGRFIVLLFQKSFFGRENVRLTSELLAELSGILNWALDGYDSLVKRGHFVQPKNASDTIEKMERLAAPIQAFIEDMCVVGPSYEILSDALYAQYQRWCEKGGVVPSGKEWFGRLLYAAVPELREAKLKTGDGRQRYYVGIELGPF
jgi:putative DNA primase/helicase